MGGLQCIRYTGWCWHCDQPGMRVRVAVETPKGYPCNSLGALKNIKIILDFFLQYLLKKYWKNIQKTWKYFEILKECSKNIQIFAHFLNVLLIFFLKNIEEKNLVFYKCSFNILNKIWDLAPCGKDQIQPYMIKTHPNLTRIRCKNTNKNYECCTIFYWRIWRPPCLTLTQT